MNDAEQLEAFLQKKASLNNNIATTIVRPDNPDRLVADKSASIDDFIIMLSGLVAKALKKNAVELQPDEGIRLQADQAEHLEHPYIFFKIISCQPQKELKPRIRQDEITPHLLTDDEGERRPREIWGQLFTYLVQFDILASGYKEATKVMNDVEDLIFTYTAFFKRNGVKDIRFTRRETDSNLDMYRQKCSVRSIQYTVDIEKLFSRFDPEIGNVDVR